MYDKRNGFNIEYWFGGVVYRTGVAAKKDYSAVQLKNICTTYLPEKTASALNFNWDKSDPDEWLDRVIKIDKLIELEDVKGNMLTIAIDITANPNKASKKLRDVSSKAFDQIRETLGIQCLWILVITDIDKLPEDQELLGHFFDSLEEGEDWCQIITV